MSDDTAISASHLDVAIIPAGTPVARSAATPLFGQPGGAQQIYLPSTSTLRATGPAPAITVPGTYDPIHSMAAERKESR